MHGQRIMKLHTVINHLCNISMSVRYSLSYEAGEEGSDRFFLLWPKYKKVGSSPLVCLNEHYCLEGSTTVVSYSPETAISVIRRRVIMYAWERLIFITYAHQNLDGRPDVG